MTSWRIPNFDGTPVDVTLRHGRSELVESITEAILAGVAIYRDLPSEVIHVDVRAVIQENLAVFTGCLVRGELPAAAELDQITESAYRRAEEGIGLEMVVSAYVVAVQHAWRMVTARSGPGDIADLRRVTDFVMGYLDRILGAACAAYVEELRSSYSQEQSLRSTLVGALLSGEAVAEAAMQAGVELPATYAVIGLEIVGPVPGDTPLQTSVNARRVARRLRTAVAGASNREALVRLDHTGGVVLFPNTRSAGDADAAVGAARVDDFVASLRDAVEGQLTATIATSPPQEVSATVAVVRDLLAIVRLTRRPAGSYRLDDLLLEYQLHQQTPATAPLAGLLAPLATSPHLIETLRVHLAAEMNRKRTATALNVHPNTVDYRLRRVAELTGLDPTVPSQADVLIAALAATAVLAGREQAGHGSGAAVESG